MAERAFPRTADPGALFAAPSVDAPDRPFLSPDAADRAAPRPAVFRPAGLQPDGTDIELVAPPSVAEDADQGTADPDPIQRQFHPADDADLIEVVPPGYQDPSEQTDEAMAAQEAPAEEPQETPYDITADPRYVEAVRELEQRRAWEQQVARQAEQARQAQVAQSLQQDVAETQQRRAQLFRGIPEATPEQVQAAVAEELRQADARAAYWMKAAFGAVNHVNGIQQLAATVERHGLNENEAQHLMNVPPHLLDQQAAAIVGARRQQEGELTRLRAENARLSQQVGRAAKAGSRDPRVNLVGGGSSTGGGGARRRVEAGSDAHIAALLGLAKR
jgi:hypothetical protein